MRLGRIATAKGLLPLPLAGEGWGGGAAAIHAVRVERVSPTRIASSDAMRPPPQAGEVQQVRGQTDSTKNHPALENGAKQIRIEQRRGCSESLFSVPLFGRRHFGSLDRQRST